LGGWGGRFGGGWGGGGGVGRWCGWGGGVGGGGGGGGGWGCVGGGGWGGWGGCGGGGGGWGGWGGGGGGGIDPRSHASRTPPNSWWKSVESSLRDRGPMSDALPVAVRRRGSLSSVLISCSRRMRISSWFRSTMSADCLEPDQSSIRSRPKIAFALPSGINWRGLGAVWSKPTLRR